MKDLGASDAIYLLGNASETFTQGEIQGYSKQDQFKGNSVISSHHKSNHDASSFLDLLDSMGLKQHVQGLTKKTGHTLDRILPCSFDHLLTDPVSIMPDLTSDHQPVCCSINQSAVPSTCLDQSDQRLQSYIMTSTISTLNPSTTISPQPSCHHQQII